MSLLAGLLDESLLAAELGAPPKEIWLAIRSDTPVGAADDALLGSGTVDDPYNANTAKRFDLIMKDKAGEGVIVRVGPGVFRTQGFGTDPDAVNPPWRIKPGQQIIGAGIYATTILFTPEVPFLTNSGAVVACLEIEHVDNFTISDLTIDCNLQNQPTTPIPLAIQAIRAIGDNVVISRVRVINFGTRTPNISNGSSISTGREGFPVRLGGRATTRSKTEFLTLDEFTSFNALAENLIIEQPDTSPAREVTCLVVVGGILFWASPDYKLPASYGEYAGYGERLHLQPFGGIARNCYLNLEYVNGRAGSPVAIDSISYSGTAPNVLATVTTRFPHNVNAGWNDYVSFVGASDATLLRGRFIIGVSP